MTRAAMEKLIQSGFEAQAILTPHNLAITESSFSWTYGELDSYSNKLAYYFKLHNLKEGETVAIVAQRSSLLVWAVLGALKAGLAFYIVDPTFPQKRLIECLRLVKASALVEMGDNGYLPFDYDVVGHALKARVVLKGKGVSNPSLEELSEDRPQISKSPQALAYIVFTSGTTGVPKGVMGAHYPIVHFIKWYTRRFAFTHKERFAMLSGLCHDPLLRDIFAPLGIGACLHVPDAECYREHIRLREWITQEEISVIHITPTLSSNLRIGAYKGCYDNLRHVFWGGEMLTNHEVNEIALLAPNALLVNFYGTTETPQAISYEVVGHAKDRQEGRSCGVDKDEFIPIGRGIDGVQLLIRRDDDNVAKVGEVGEILVQSKYLSIGYVDEQDKRSNISRIANSKDIYRTGDLGYYLPDHRVAIIGRNDRQTKIFGNRVELEEIEYALNMHPQIVRAVVVKQNDKSHLSAYVVPILGAKLANRELRIFLEDYLPGHMIPSQWIYLASIPTTQSGKIDYGSLPSFDMIAQKDNHVPPNTFIEKHLAMIWSRVIGLIDIGIHDSFFELGGNSIASNRILSDVAAELGCEVGARVFFNNPTIYQLGQHIESSYFEWFNSENIQSTLERGGDAAAGIVSRLENSHERLVP